MNENAVEIQLVGAGDERVFSRIAPDIFDGAINPTWLAEFLADPRHHLAVAIDQAHTVIGFVSAVHYMNPDKPAELWINEIAVAAAWRGRGIAKSLLDKMLKRGRELGCKEAWVLTDRSNLPAMRLYAALGGIEPPRDQVMFTFRF